MCKKIGIEFVLTCPKGYELEDCRIVYDAHEAVKDADVIYTDVWASTGQEEESAKRKKDFALYQVNSSLMKAAKKTAVFMHCLPAHRGEEVTDDVMEGKSSVVFDQAENRLHVQKAVLVKLINVS